MIPEVPFEKLFEIPLRNGLTKPKSIRGIGVKMINMGEIFANGIISEKTPMDRVPVTNSELTLSNVIDGDLLFARQSLVLDGAGKCCYIGGIHEAVVFESHLIRARLKKGIADSKFYYYYFTSQSGRNKMQTIVEQVSAAGVRSSDLARLVIPYPPLPMQIFIATTLSFLDDKIDLNNRIIANLEAQAQANFKSWFVDFEPFQDSEFEESELGLIPKGWRVGVLSDIAVITMGQSPSGESFNENEIGTVFYQGRAEFGFRFPRRRLFTTEPVRMAHSGDVLLSVRAPVGDINVATEECCIGRGLSALHSLNGCQSYLLYLVKQLHDVLDQFNGEGTVFGSINRKDLNQIAIIIPSLGNMQRFEEVVGRFDAEILTLHKENTLLVTARDTLLPKFMSGENEVQ